MHDTDPSTTTPTRNPSPQAGGEKAHLAALHPTFLIHVLTASGAALALLAMMAAVDHRWSAMFLWLGVALAVDAVDGPLARYFRIADTLPRP